MKWMAQVKLEHRDGVWLELGRRKKRVETEDMPIVDLMEAGITEDDELLRRVTEEAGGDDISAGFRLAQFVEDYGDFLAEAAPAAIF